MTDFGLSTRIKEKGPRSPEKVARPQIDYSLDTSLTQNERDVKARKEDVLSSVSPRHLKCYIRGNSPTRPQKTRKAHPIRCPCPFPAGGGEPAPASAAGASKPPAGEGGAAPGPIPRTGGPRGPRKAGRARPPERQRREGERPVSRRDPTRPGAEGPRRSAGAREGKQEPTAGPKGGANPAPTGRAGAASGGPHRGPASAAGGATKGAPTRRARRIRAHTIEAGEQGRNYFAPRDRPTGPARGAKGPREGADKYGRAQRGARASNT